MADRKTLRELAKTKLKAAKILHKAGDYDTAGYLIGYVVECALKAAICKRLNLSQYPDSGQHHDVFASHNMDRLLMLSGYSKEFVIKKNRPNKLAENWSTLTKDWKPEIRYNVNIYQEPVIQDKIEALEDQQDGFLTWIKKGKW